MKKESRNVANSNDRWFILGLAALGVFTTVSTIAIGLFMIS